MKDVPHGSLRLTLPVQKPGEHLLVETRIDHLAQWLKSQPYGNMPVTVSNVRRSLHGFNRTEIASSSRMKGMFLYNRAYQLIAGYYTPQSFRSDKRQEKVSVQEKKDFFLLTQEMAYGYKLLAVQLQKENASKDVLANTLNLTVYYLSLVLMLHYDAYAPPPKNIWKEINNILGFAVVHQFVDRISESHQLQGCLNTIEENYNRIALIALANPYHLNAGQHWPIWRYLSHWVRLAELSEDLSDFHKDQTFVVDLCGDYRPHFALSTDKLDESTTLLLLPQKLVQQVESHLVDLRTEGKPPLPGFGSDVTATAAERLLEVMQYHWQMFKHRAAPRYKTDDKLKVICSLVNIHAELTRNDPLYQTEETEPQFVIPTSSWRTINTSATGICMNTHIPVREMAVGKLIALSIHNHQEDRDFWRLATVRWQQKSRTDGHTVGAELILGDIQAVRFIIPGANERKELGFIISGEHGDDGSTPPTIIFAHNALPKDKPIIMEVGDETFGIRLTRPLQHTLFFTQSFYQQCPVQEALDIARQELEEIEEQRRREEAGEEVIDMEALPGFTSVQNDKSS